LINTATISTKLGEIEVPCYKIGEKIIWGATAMIISELTEVISTRITIG